MDRKTLIEVFNHAVLPPRLPGAQPDLPFLNLVEQDLVSRMVEASELHSCSNVSHSVGPSFLLSTINSY